MNIKKIKIDNFKKIETATIDLDAVLVAIGLTTVDLDAILRATGLGIVTLDTILRLSQQFNIELDAIISEIGTKLALVSIDAIIRTIAYPIQTMIAHSIRTFVSKGY